MLAAALLFLSGSSALVYQTLWVRQLSLVVGVDVHAVSIAVSAFFAGLGLGALVFGARADRAARPFLLYAALEVGVAVLAVASTILLARAAPLFVALQTRAGWMAWCFPFLLVGAPAFLMGGTLPVLLRASAPPEGRLGRSAGVLYAANTAGAIVGTLATPFLLVPAFGIRSTALTAAALNLALAAVAFTVRRPRPVEPDPVTPPRPEGAGLALLLYAAAGGIALGYEVVWSQAIVQFLATRTYAFAVVLATYLSGLVAGSFLYARFSDRVRHPWTTFGLLIAGAGALSVLTLSSLGPWLPQAQDALGKGIFRLTGSDMLANCLRFGLAGVVLILLPTTALGAAFPAAVRVAAGGARVGRDVGAVAALNTIGGIGGTFLAGFFLVPAFGLVGTLSCLAVAAAVLGGIAVARGGGWRVRPVSLGAALVVAVFSAASFLPADKLARLLVATRGGELVFHEESTGGAVAVIEQTASRGTFRRLYIHGVSNTGDAMTSLRYMRLQALLPLLVHRGEPRSALVVGLGTGITCGALLAFPSLDKRVCVELLPAVVHAAGHFRGNYGVTGDPRIEVRVGDGRHELLRHGERYDLVTLEPPPPSAVGVANLYSTEFYELCRERLAENGLLAQWWPLPTQNDEDSRSIVRSVLDVFPHVTLWTTELHEMLLLASMQPIELDVDRTAKRFASRTVQEALAEVGIASPAALLGTYVTDRAGLERYAAGAAPITDDRPMIEYAGWVRDGEFARVLSRVLQLSTPPPLTGSAGLEAEVAARRQTLFGFYRTALYALAGDRERWADGVRRVMQADGDNPYYRWFLGSRQSN